MVEWFIELALKAPGATAVILAISAGLSLLNSLVNRLLIDRTIGWEEYKRMQKELSEYRAQLFRAQRTRDEKLLQKLRRQERRINYIQRKVAKPQFLFLLISFGHIAIIWWLFLVPVYGLIPVAFVPGFGWTSVLWWYFLCAMLFGTLSSRLFLRFREE